VAGTGALQGVAGLADSASLQGEFTLKRPAVLAGLLHCGALGGCVPAVDGGGSGPGPAGENRGGKADGGVDRVELPEDVSGLVEAFVQHMVTAGGDFIQDVATIIVEQRLDGTFREAEARDNERAVEIAEEAAETGRPLSEMMADHFRQENAERGDV
jgi:hypothetical protein